MSGLGRAPGTDQVTLRALRRAPEAAEEFPRDVLELQALFAEAGPEQRVRAVPGAGLKVPLWILGSSLFGAQLAAMLGLPFAFASHFAPGHAEAGARHLPRPLRAVRTARRALRDGRLQRDRRGQRGARRAGSSPRRSRVSRIWCAGRAASCRRRSTTSRAIGRPPRRRTLRACWLALSSERGGALRSSSRGFSPRPGRTNSSSRRAIYDHRARLRSYEILAEAMALEPGGQALNAKAIPAMSSSGP